MGVVLSHLPSISVCAIVALWAPAGSFHADARIGGLCARLEPSSHLDGLESYYERESRVQESHRRDLGLEGLRSDLPRLFSQLDDADPMLRIQAVAELGVARSWLRPRGAEALDFVRPLLDRLSRESQGQVVEEIIRVLGTRSDTPGLAPVLIELFSCDREPELRSAALDVATLVPDPTMLEPLLEVWKDDLERDDRGRVLRVLAKLSDRRSVGVAVQGLETMFMEAQTLMRAVGSQGEAPRVIELHKEQYSGDPMLRGGMLALIGDLGGPEALAYLRSEFQRSEGDDRVQLARLALRAQLEPGKPEWTEADQRNCVPLEAIRTKRLPYVERDVERLLREENEPLFRLLGGSYRDVRDSLMEWSWARRSDPQSQVAHWRRVLSMLGTDPSVEWSPAAEPTRELAKALASLASLEARPNPSAAVRDIEEAIALWGHAWGAETSTAERLQEVKARVERLLQRSRARKSEVLPARKFSGTYQRSTGFEGHTLTLDTNGTFKFEGQSDAMDACTWGRFGFAGTFAVEAGRLALDPGPSMKRHGISAPDLFLPVIRGSRLYLLEDSELAGFCMLEREDRLRDDTHVFYSIAVPAGILRGVLDSTAACAR